LLICVVLDWAGVPLEVVLLPLFPELPAPDAKGIHGRASRLAAFQHASSQFVEARVADRDVRPIPVAPEQKELLAVVARFW
jgi:hypothetical protein